MAETANGYTYGICSFRHKFLVVCFAMSVLAALHHAPADTAYRKTVRGWRKQIDEQENNLDRSRSPRRNRGAKAMLQSWAKGEISAAGIWRLAHAIVEQDGSDCGAAMHRIDNLASQRSGSEKNA